MKLIETTRIEEGIHQLVLNNPPMNLMTMEMTSELDAALESLASEPSLRVLIVTGAGRRAFCSGSDIREFTELARSGTAVDSKVRFENQAFAKLSSFSKPTIAQLRGHALGGGLELAACCDFIIAAGDAKLGLPEVRIGVFPGSGGTFRVTRRIGEARAKEMMLFGRLIEPETAREWGLVNWVVPGDRLQEETLAKARSLASLPSRSLQLCKEAIHLSHGDENEIMRKTIDLQADVFATEDCLEGAKAFLGKVPPDWRHR